MFIRILENFNNVCKDKIKFVFVYNSGLLMSNKGGRGLNIKGGGGSNIFSNTIFVT